VIVAQCKNCNTPLKSEHVFCCFCGFESEPAPGEQLLPENLNRPGESKNSLLISDSGTIPDAVLPGTVPDAILPGTMPDAVPAITGEWQQNDFTKLPVDEGTVESIPFPDLHEANGINDFPSEVPASSVPFPELSDKKVPETSVAAGDTSLPPFRELSGIPDTPTDSNALPFPAISEGTDAVPFPPIPNEESDALPFPDIPDLQQDNVNDAQVFSSDATDMSVPDIAQQVIQKERLPNIESNPAIDDVQKSELPVVQSSTTPVVVQQSNVETQTPEEEQVSKINLEALLESENKPECCDMCGEIKAAGAIYCTACGCRI
jgi:hypothetical protein